MKKFLPVILSIALLVMPGVEKMSAQTPDENRLQVFTDIGTVTNISDNAKWAVAFSGESLGSQNLAHLINLETETVIDLPGDSKSKGYDVSNDGTAVGMADDFPAYWTTTGECHPLPMPSGDFTEGVAMCITPDAKIICGSAMSAELASIALRWIRQDDGTYKYEKLEVLDKDLFGKVPYGFCADVISPDGTMIAGRMTDGMHYKWFPVLWKNAEKPSKPVIIGQEFMLNEDGSRSGWDAFGLNFTMDNKYLFCTMGELGWGGIKHAFAYDVKANEGNLLGETTDHTFNLLLTDGRIITASPEIYTYRSSFIDFPGKEGEGQKLEDYVQQHFGVNMLDQLDASGTLMATSADEKSFVGFAGYAQSTMASFCLRIANDLTSVAVEKIEMPVVYTQADGSIAVSGTKGARVTLSDMTGRVIDTLHAADSQVIFAGVKGQVYLVKVAFDKVSYLTKVIVK